MMFNASEIENIRQLLASPDERNVSLGLELVFANPSVVSNLVAPLFLKLFFGEWEEDDWSEDGEPVRGRRELEDLLYEQLDGELITQHKEALKLFRYLEDGHHIEHYDFVSFNYLGNYEVFRSEYEPIILKNPFYAPLYKLLAELLAEDYGKVKEAYPYYKKAIIAMPQDIGAKIDYANFLIEQCFSENLFLEEFSVVVNILYEAMNYFPSYKTHYLLNLAIAYRKYDDVKKAVKTYRELLALDPEDLSGLNNLALLLFPNGGEDLNEAYDLARQAYELAPQDIHIADTFAWITLKGIGDLEQAYKLFTKVRSLDKQNTHHQSMTAMGEVYEGLGEYEEATQFYESGLKLSPKSIYKLEKLADLYALKLQEYKKAKSCYQKILKIEPNHQHAKEMLGKL